MTDTTIPESTSAISAASDPIKTSTTMEGHTEVVNAPGKEAENQNNSGSTKPDAGNEGKSHLCHHVNVSSQS